ncbi:MAG TPA: 50S ribosomal protein L7ae [Halobacteria archaeon]|nr:50S ribosomal protein L7ae [Halobacteria archaeon]
MARPIFVKFDVPAELEKESLDLLSEVKDTGRIKKGTNEVTKTVERGMARLVYISEDVEPEEIVAHIPLLCEEKGIPYIYIKNKNELGDSCGLTVPTAAAAIVDLAKGKDALDKLIKKIKSLKKE